MQLLRLICLIKLLVLLGILCDQCLQKSIKQHLAKVYINQHLADALAVNQGNRNEHVSQDFLKGAMWIKI